MLFFAKQRTQDISIELKNTGLPFSTGFKENHEDSFKSLDISTACSYWLRAAVMMAHREAELRGSLTCPTRGTF